MISSRLAWLIGWLSVISALAPGARASAAVPGCDEVATRRQSAWPAPLDRRITVRGGVLSRRDALDRVAAAASVRLSYSDALLALDQRVCLDVDDQPLGDVLALLIGRAEIAPQVAGGELIVLAPQPATTRNASPSVRPMRAASLERVVVTGTAVGGAERSLSTAVSVVDGRTLEANGAGTVGAFINGRIPGMWLWEQSPTAALARYASVRGASSFSVSYPKIYVDGIELANPLVAAHVPSESVERVEVLRGPQGAALYGSDAISGVVHLQTRQPSGSVSAQRTRLHAQVGQISSAYSDAGVLAHEYLLSGQLGSGAHAAAGSVGYLRTGAFVPDAAGHHLSMSTRARLIGQSHVLDATARFVSADIASSSNPLVLTAITDAIVLPDSVRPLLGARRRQQWRDSLARRLSLDRTARQSVRQFTGGLTGTLHPSGRWTHRITAGVDAYALNGATGGTAPLPSSSDSAVRAAEGSAMRLSARASSAATWSGDTWSRTLTFSTEHALLREATSNAVLARPREVVVLDREITAVWRRTHGLVAQLDTDWRNRWFVTAGSRVERSDGFTEHALVTLLPMIGTAIVFDAPGVTTKLRGAYGKGIRPPRATIGATSVANARLLGNGALEAEQQAGTEVGADVHVGSNATLHITRFDQRATGLVQPVTVVVPTNGGAGPRPGDPLGRNLAYQLQNIGAIENDGWELAASLRGGPLSVHGTLATVDSRVRAIRRGYTGELRLGDRMLNVPGRTLGLAVRIERPAWSSVVQVARVEDWIGYDRIAATTAFVSAGRPSADFVGPALRQFWIEYPGVTRLNVAFTRALAGNLMLQLSGENLLGVQTGEPDNVTIVPGRTLSIGVRARF